MALVVVLTLEARLGGRALVSNQAVLVNAGGRLVEEKRTRAGAFVRTAFVCGSMVQFVRGMAKRMFPLALVTRTDPAEISQRRSARTVV